MQNTYTWDKTVSLPKIFQNAVNIHLHPEKILDFLQLKSHLKKIKNLNFIAIVFERINTYNDAVSNHKLILFYLR